MFPIFNLPTNNDQEVFPTGLPGLDNLLKGGLRIGHLYVVVGEFCAGKTAFCRRILAANGDAYFTLATSRKFAPIYDRPGFSVEGSNDLVELGENGVNIFIPNHTTKLNEIREKPHWETMCDIVCDLKNHAVENNLAIIWTVPTQRISTRHADSFYWVRSVDCLLMIDRDNKKLCVRKNRYGPEGIIDIKFGRYKNAAVMYEA